MDRDPAGGGGEGGMLVGSILEWVQVIGQAMSDLTLESFRENFHFHFLLSFLADTWDEPTKHKIECAGLWK